MLGVTANNRPTFNILENTKMRKAQKQAAGLMGPANRQ